MRVGKRNPEATRTQFASNFGEKKSRTKRRRREPRTQCCMHRARCRTSPKSAATVSSISRRRRQRSDAHRPPIGATTSLQAIAVGRGTNACRRSGQRAASCPHSPRNCLTQGHRLKSHTKSQHYAPPDAASTTVSGALAPGFLVGGSRNGSYAPHPIPKNPPSLARSPSRCACGSFQRNKSWEQIVPPTHQTASNSATHHYPQNLSATHPLMFV